MTSPALVSMQDVSVIRDGKVLLHPIRFSILPQQQWALLGPSGSGKTLLTLALTGEVQHAGQVVMDEHLTLERIPQQHQFRNLSNTRDFYYQQRYQSQDAEDTYTLGAFLHDSFTAFPARAQYYLDKLHLAPLRDKPLIQLSNGENKRAQLLRALVRKPSLLILDNPFIGLDAEGRTSLQAILNTLATEGIQFLLIAPREELPDCITHILHLEQGSVEYSGTRMQYRPPHHDPVPENLLNRELLNRIPVTPSVLYRYAVEMRDVHVQYEGRQILSGINWTVEKGTRWLVSGPNGAGKSTLLSLITADNPQAYANEISLFDQQRGRGESIWDIKRKIGYVSPELHLFFEQGITALQVVASGLFDTIGLFRPLSEAQEAQAADWMALLHVDSLRQQPLYQLSLGQQRMVLLARALVKNPPLLILDEPCQGLDETQTQFFNRLVQELCLHFGTTLIYVSHYTQQVPSCIDHYFELKEGKRSG